MKNTIYLGLGSNIGDRNENLIVALSFLQSSELIYISKVSSFYQTSPIGPKQRSFYNAVIKANTNLNPVDTLLLLKQIEKLLGRVKNVRFGPRLIDIDILFYNDQTLFSRTLTIPHKQIQNRLFVLVPLAEIAKNFIHPVFNQKIGDMLSEKLLTLIRQKVRILW